MSGDSPIWDGNPEPELGENLVLTDSVIAEDHETAPVRRARAERAARRLWEAVKALLQQGQAHA